jgi:hypothetical protein
MHRALLLAAVDGPVPAVKVADQRPFEADTGS